MTRACFIEKADAAPSRPDVTHLPPLWVRTTAGPSIGYGHLRRTLNLAVELARWARPVFVLEADDIWTPRQVAVSGWESIGFDPVGMWRQKELPAAVLVDTRQVCGTREFVEQARRREIPVVSIHDLGLSPIPSDVVIDGSIAPDHTGFSPTAHFYTGTAYLVLDRSYAALPADRKEARETIQRVVVNLGGGDSRRYFDRVLRGLQLWGRNLEVIGVPGFSCWGQDEFASRDWLPVHFRWIRGDEHLEQMVFGADLAVTAGGLSLYEALCAGTPALALSYDELQQTTVSSVARVNACVGLGRGDVLRPAQLPRVLTLLEQDISGRQALSTRGRRIVDGRGMERVCQIVRDVILSSAIGNVEAGNDSGARV